MFHGDDFLGWLMGVGSIGLTRGDTFAASLSNSLRYKILVIVYLSESLFEVDGWTVSLIGIVGSVARLVLLLCHWSILILAGIELSLYFPHWS